MSQASAVTRPASEASASQGPGGTVLSAILSRLVIVVPYLWLLVFFLAPFAIVFKISLSETTIAMPPYLPVFSADDGLGGLLTKARQLSFESYLWLLDDALYINAYISSLVIAGVSTFLALLVGYPLAYAMARAPGSMRMILLM